MANANAPTGFRPVFDGKNRPYTGGGNVYYRPSSDANAIYPGDPVVLNGSGDTNGVPAVVLATAGTGNRLTGFVTGILPDATSIPAMITAGGAKLAASTAGYLLVEDDPNVTFEGQASTAAATDIGANVNLHSGTGSTLSGSGWYADGSQIATTSTYQLRITGFAQRPDNATGAYAKILVRINQTSEAAGGTGF
jgi:hypothetical protein